MTTSIQSGSTAKISLLNAILLISGTCIGGGMLAIPILTAEIGFWLSSLVLLLCWGFMTFTGLLLIEATFWVKAQAHFSTLSQFLLGRFGKILSLIVYLFMNVLSLVAYTSGGAILIDGWLKNFLGIEAGYTLCCFLFTFLFGGFVYLGISFVTKVNDWFSVLMGLFFFYLIGLGLSRIQPEYLQFRPLWMGTLNAFPIILASFSYQMIIPSLCSYLNYEIKSLKKAVFIGTSLPFGIYFVWLFVIHGLVPLEGADGLRETAQKGALIIEPMRLYLATPFLTWIVDGFAFFALTTSYFGLSIALLDFLHDLFRSQGKNPSKKWITAISLMPCLFLAIFFPKALVNCLDMSGGFGDALLSGLIPIAMVWIGRYIKKLPSEYTAPGGKSILLVTGLFSLAVFIFQWVKIL